MRWPTDESCVNGIARTGARSRACPQLGAWAASFSLSALLLCLSSACAPRNPAPAGATLVAPGVRVEVIESTPSAIREQVAQSIRAAHESQAWPPQTLVDQLAESGYLSAELTRYPDSLWVIVPGTRISAVRIDWEVPDSAGAGVDLPAFQRIPIPEGGGIQAAIEGAAASALARLDRAGRPLARMQLADADADSVLALRVAVDAGPVVCVTQIHFAGDRTTRPAFLRRAIGWRGPETYRGERWRLARQSLLATGLFESVGDPRLVHQARVAAMPPGREPAARETLASEILFDLRPRRVNAVSGLLGYADRAGNAEERRGRVSGYVDLALGNLFGTGRAARLFWQGLGEDHSQVELAWHEPFLWRLPLGVDLGLTHTQEDTLYADTRWGADLLWSPSPAWHVSAGWGRSRLVLGGEDSVSLSRDLTRFRVARIFAEGSETPRGWSLDLAVEQVSGDGADLKRGTFEVAEWFERGRWRVRLEQAGGLLSGPDSVLRGEAFLLGGGESLRGSYEGEFRSTGYVLQRAAIGPRLDAQGGWIYALFDVAGLDVWDPSPTGTYGKAGKRQVQHAYGMGLRLAGRSGIVRLEYAIPNGASPLSGRVHFGVGGSF